LGQIPLLPCQGEWGGKSLRLEIGIGPKFGYGIAIRDSIEFPLSRSTGEEDGGKGDETIGRRNFKTGRHLWNRLCPCVNWPIG